MQDPPVMYKVPSKGLDLSVALFLFTAFFAVLLMAVRRKLLRGELGGGYKGRVFSAGLLVALWVFYIVMSSLAQYEKLTFLTG